ncbi:hypothetical protein NGM37_18735, partial [Streptomyces sp. TRM76130]|nr:hypothetical protein [Streptomyces sp. TRM76130]
VGPVFTADDPGASLAAETSAEPTTSTVTYTADAVDPPAMTVPDDAEVSSVRATLDILSGEDDEAAAERLGVRPVTQ